MSFYEVIIKDENMQDMGFLGRTKEKLFENLRGTLDITEGVIFPNEGFSFEVENAGSISREKLEERIRDILVMGFENVSIDITYHMTGSDNQ